MKAVFIVRCLVLLQSVLCALELNDDRCVILNAQRVEACPYSQVRHRNSKLCPNAFDAAPVQSCKKLHASLVAVVAWIQLGFFFDDPRKETVNPRTNLQAALGSDAFSSS